MRNNISIGLVVPFAEDKLPAEGPRMYPGVRFIAKGVGVRALTPVPRVRTVQLAPSLTLPRPKLGSTRLWHQMNRSQQQPTSDAGAGKAGLRPL